MQLDKNWKTIAKKSWSFKWNILGVVLGSVALAFPYFYDMMILSPSVFAVVFLCINLGAGFVRLLYQPGFEED